MGDIERVPEKGSINFLEYLAQRARLALVTGNAVSIEIPAGGIDEESIKLVRLMMPASNGFKKGVTVPVIARIFLENNSVLSLGDDSLDQIELVSMPDSQTGELDGDPAHFFRRKSGN